MCVERHFIWIIIERHGLKFLCQNCLSFVNTRKHQMVDVISSQKLFRFVKDSDEIDIVNGKI